MKKIEVVIKQLFRFGIVGVFVTALDFGLVYFWGTYTKLPVLAGTFLAYVLATIVNYILTVKWVFVTDENHKKNLTIFVGLGIIALGITQFVMWVGTEKFSLYFMFVKVIATIIVNIFNFVTRKLFLEVNKTVK